MSFVLDSSVALAWCFRDEQTPAVMELLDRVVAEGAVAPLLWPRETINGLYMAHRRRRIDSVERNKLVGFLRDLPIRMDEETAGQTWTATAELADHFRLTIYDATYLELARRRGLPLGSLDGALRQAATHLGLATLGTADQ